MSQQGVTPQDYMENWLLQINYPQISVQLKASSGKTSVSFKQSRFTLNENRPAASLGISSPFE